MQPFSFMLYDMQTKIQREIKGCMLEAKEAVWARLSSQYWVQTAV